MKITIEVDETQHQDLTPLLHALRRIEDECEEFMISGDETPPSAEFRKKVMQICKIRKSYQESLRYQASQKQS